MRLRWALAAVFPSILATSLIAEDSALVVSGNTFNHRNIYFADYSVIPDHPDCDDEGEVAVAVQFATPAWSYEVRDLVTAFRVWKKIDETATVDDSNCPLTTRRGTETTVSTRQCTPEETEERRRETELWEFNLRIDGEFEACLSPVDYRLLDSSWTIDVSDANNQVQYDGAFVEPGQAGRTSWNSDPDIGPVDRVDEPNAALSMQIFRTFFGPTTVAIITLECIPFTVSDYASYPIYLETRFHLFLAEDPVTSCLDENCSRSERQERVLFPHDNWVQRTLSANCEIPE